MAMRDCFRWLLGSILIIIICSIRLIDFVYVGYYYYLFHFVRKFFLLFQI
jgi:hypothetical protein